jgi:hypothetical protein
LVSRRRWPDGSRVITRALGQTVPFQGFTVHTDGDSDSGAGSGGPPNSLIVHKEIEVTVRSTPGKSRIRESSCLSEADESTLIFNR